MAKKACKRRNVELFLQDKAYDAEKHHEFVRHELKAEMIAPLRKHEKKIKGFYRKQMRELPTVYKKRASIRENGNSILKNSLGDTIGKILIYNLEKVIKINY